MWTWQQLLQLRVPIRWLGWRCASGTCALAQLPRLPALLKCGFREMAPREEKEPHRRDATHTCSACGVRPDSGGLRRLALVARVGTARGQCARCVSVRVRLRWCVGVRGPGAAREECFLQKTKKNLALAPPRSRSVGPALPALV